MFDTHGHTRGCIYPLQLDFVFFKKSLHLIKWVDSCTCLKFFYLSTHQPYLNSMLGSNYYSRPYRNSDLWYLNLRAHRNSQCFLRFGPTFVFFKQNSLHWCHFLLISTCALTCRYYIGAVILFFSWVLLVFLCDAFVIDLVIQFSWLLKGFSL